jgi:predicted metal-dependent hydrolase
MNITYSIKYSARKTISIIVERDRTVVVRAPLNTSEELIAKEIGKRKRLLLKKIEHNQKYPFPKIAKEFVSGETLLYLGKDYKLFIVDDLKEEVVFDNKFFIDKKNQKRANTLIKKWYIKSAAEIIVPKAKELAKQLGVSFHNINIMDLKFRWGSCTPKNNIHFNWRIIKAPMIVIEYIIIHELTHLLEANHTPEFWNRVAVMQPNYQKAKNWLKEFGAELETDF